MTRQELIRKIYWIAGCLAVFTLIYIFLGGSPPGCEDAADSNDDSRIQIADVSMTIGVRIAS